MNPVRTVYHLNHDRKVHDMRYFCTRKCTYKKKCSTTFLSGYTNVTKDNQIFRSSRELDDRVLWQPARVSSREKRMPFQRKKYSTLVCSEFVKKKRGTRRKLEDQMRCTK